MNTRLRNAATALALAVPLFASAGHLAAQGLTVQRIFGSPDFRLAAVDPQWDPNGEGFTAVELNPQTRATDLWTEGVRTGKRTRLVQGATLIVADSASPVLVEQTTWSPNRRKLLIYANSQRVWRQNTKGTYYVYDLASRRLTPLSTKPGWQQFAKFSPDGERVGFVRDNNLFIRDLASGRETQLTGDGSANIINGTTDWVYEEELGLQDAWRWSPDGKRIAFWRFDQSPVPTFTLENDLTQYPTPFTYHYPKAGEPNSRVKIGVIGAEGGTPTWVNTGAESDVYLPRMDWAESPDQLVIQKLNRHQNRLEVLLADALSGQVRPVFTETDSAWVDVDDDLTWLKGGRQFLWTSERDGWNHVYLYDRSGKLVRQVTHGPWEVTGIAGVDEKNGWLYFTSTEAGPAERQLYRVHLDGTGKQRISREPGTHGVSMNSTATAYVDVFSRAGIPPVYRLMNADGTPIRTLEDNAQVAARLAALKLRAPEFITVPGADGTPLRAWIIRPPDFDPSKKYPVLMYVYGGPGSQTVTDAWGGSRYLWHQLLAERGYVVVSVDNRGTGARGRRFKKQTYLQLGRYESDDQIAAARWLAKQPYVDAARIGIWGWSYGGYMAGLTPARGGSVFRTGLSVAPVTDWRLYDNIYTERFMRTPAENPEGYRESAVTTHADGLAARYLLIHGTGDDNVHFQNSVQLVNALEVAGKQFQLMIYPNRTHSISGGNTSEHLFTLMTDWVTANL